MKKLSCDNISISIKITFLVGVLLIPLLIGTVATYLKTSESADSTQSIYNNEISTFQYTSSLQLIFEQQFGIAKSAPNTADVEHIAFIKDDYETNIFIVNDYLEEFGKSDQQHVIDLVSKVNKLQEEMNTHANSIFANASLFAKDQANDTLKNKFMPIADDINSILQNAKSIADEEAEDKISRLVKASRTFVLVYIVAMAIIIAVLSATAIYISRNISSRTRTLTKQMSEVADGKYDTEILYLDTYDEIGAMARALSIFQKKSIERAELAAEQEQEQEKKLQRTKEIENLVQEFETKTSKVVQLVANSAVELHETAGSMSDIINTATTKSDSVAISSKEANENVRTVASAAEEMRASADEIATQLANTNTVVTKSVEEVENADKTTQQLSEAADRIGNVVELIRGIAEQINLLALNATIESARAGEAGKGFAVVASEVKNLASQASKAVEEIVSEVDNMQSVSGNVVDVLKNIKEGVSNINEYTSNVSAAVEEQSSTTQEISENMQHASSGVRTIVADISEVSQAAKQADFSASEVLESAKELSAQSEVLQRDISDFLEHIKTK